MDDKLADHAVSRSRDSGIDRLSLQGSEIGSEPVPFRPQSSSISIQPGSMGPVNVAKIAFRR